MGGGVFSVGEEQMCCAFMQMQREGASRPRDTGIERAKFPAVLRHVSDGG